MLLLMTKFICYFTLSQHDLLPIHHGREAWSGGGGSSRLRWRFKPGRQHSTPCPPCCLLRQGRHKERALEKVFFLLMLQTLHMLCSTPLLLLPDIFLFLPFLFFLFKVLCGCASFVFSSWCMSLYSPPSCLVESGQLVSSSPVQYSGPFPSQKRTATEFADTLYLAVWREGVELDWKVQKWFSVASASQCKW